MDAGDFAQRNGDVYLDAALKTQLRKSEASFVKREARDTRYVSRDTQQTCCDCGDKIGPARLAANPQAVRCIGCQTIKEVEDKNGHD